MAQGVLPIDQNFKNAVGGTSSATDTNASIRPFQYNATTRGITVHMVGSDLSGSGIASIAHGVKVVAVAGTDEALATSTACKRVTIMAQTDNTSIIAVGASGVDATVATGTGIVLYPGDSYELDIDNLADIYIDALVSGEGVRFVYFN